MLSRLIKILVLAQFERAPAEGFETKIYEAHTLPPELAGPATNILYRV